METDNLELLQRMLLGEASQQIETPCLLGDERVILAGNPAACTLLDYPLPDLLRQGPVDISRISQEEIEQLFAVLRDRGQLSGTVWLRQRDGSAVAMAFRAWLVTVAGAAAWFAFFRPAVGELPTEPIVLTEPIYA